MGNTHHSAEFWFATVVAFLLAGKAALEFGVCSMRAHTLRRRGFFAAACGMSVLAFGWLCMQLTGELVDIAISTVF